MKPMRRNRPTTVSALVTAVFALALFCPCPSGTAQSPASEHDCCAPAVGVRAAEAGCCVDGATPASQAATLAAPTPALGAPVPVAVVPTPTLEPTVDAWSHPGQTALSPPLVLRI